MCVMSNQTCAALLFDFEIMYIISDQIALYSIQLPLLIRILYPDQSVSKIYTPFFWYVYKNNGKLSKKVPWLLLKALASG